ncbi:multidrug resistance-associated protein 1 [Bicyclus anynana]|uniref:Multidrug resistance-associated protein 1 n=1 Tax=Bicyclus anynana TaxID=110368 RepID=A0A6J1NDF7_BICAN|nr:multidrug resistance-associated protein 1 [Bicyclus anynana]XP_023943031.2 multidrug resistance-associated protein 1 [Bicyclus anynana]XP_023943033.2 multidrug resistance-associated protein 1 [Bicyclus anynana]
MEVPCVGMSACPPHVLSAALHSLNLYCAAIAAALVFSCSSSRSQWNGVRWRGQNIRGVASLILGVTWCIGAAAASLRPGNTVRLVSALMPPLSWLASAALHISLWTRRSSAPILYLAIYWLLSAGTSAAILYNNLLPGVVPNVIDVCVQGCATILCLIVSGVDCICFYDEVTKRLQSRQKSTTETEDIHYIYNDTHFFSKITFFWLNRLLYKGYFAPDENAENNFGNIPENEKSKIYYEKFRKLYFNQKISKNKERSTSIWQCYVTMMWPNFYKGGLLKLFGDLISIIPAVGLAAIIKFIQEPNSYNDTDSEVNLEEFFSNGYVMLLIVTLALVFQAILSQNSTHLITVQGTRLKMALQSMIYDKCMRLASWSTDLDRDSEVSPLLRNPEEESNTQAGLLINLISQDTYNVMSSVWIYHYTWAIPLKISLILYLLYTKLGISAIIGTSASSLLITPIQFYIGKRISDNSKDTSKCTDHRVSKLSEILQGMNVIKLYVWEDLFNEKILQLREVELKLLNKDSAYWSLLTFITHLSAIFVTVVTFTTNYYLDKSSNLTVVNVFAGLALFNQLTIPMLIFPVTVLMIIQAMVSTKRIKDFLELPESYNARDVDDDTYSHNVMHDCDDVIDATMEENPLSEKDELNIDDEQIDNQNKANVDHDQEYLVRFRNAAFSWRLKENGWLEIDDLDIASGKLIMVVGASGSGKSSFISAILGEMHQERGDVFVNRNCSIWYAGQPPWLLEGSIKDNIVMDHAWCTTRYMRVLRATALRPDLQLLPDGDNTQLGSYGTPLSGGQRVRVCVARALYSKAKLLVLDEPFGALDAVLARHVVARALLPTARSGRTVLVATNRLELLHYADTVIVMEDGRVSGVGRLNSMSEGVLSQWAQLAEEARAAAARGGAGPPGGALRERSQLLRAVSRVQFQRNLSDDALQLDISEVTGAHLLAEVPTGVGGTWRRALSRVRPPLERQFSSPPPTLPRFKWRHEIRRAVSAVEPNTQHPEGSPLRNGSRQRLYHRTLTRWTPRGLRRFLSNNSDSSAEGQNGKVEASSDATLTSIAANGVETAAVPIPDIPSASKEEEPVLNESAVWCAYTRACGWWGVVFWVAATATQAIALAADYWLSLLAEENSKTTLSNEKMWHMIVVYALWCAGGACLSACAQAASACAGARCRRTLHERLLHATLHAPLHHHLARPAGDTLHRFSSDTLVVDKKLPMAMSRWAQLALLCGAAMLVNAVAAPWTLLAIIPAVIVFIVLQSVYLDNASELQHVEAETAARAVSLAVQSAAGAGSVRAARLQARMRAVFFRRLDRNHNALLLLNSSNRWLGLTLDLVGAASVFVSLATALYGSSGAAAGLAGTYALLLPTYLAHLAKCRADLHLQLAAVRRLLAHSRAPREDYRDDCPIPAEWQRNGKIEFQDVSVQHQPGQPPVLKNITFTVKPGEKVAVCGRSGSGKSSLVLSCVGATTITSGRLLVDDQDVMRVPLRALRHRVVVLPQEAVMFSGTLRENLDPLAVHTDEEIWQSLRAVGLYDYVTAQSTGLECSMGGWRGCWNGSRGARVCAARAALHARTAAALLLDEPGAALDASAERALLRAVAALAPNTTVITVAHRLSSVRGYDSVVVLEDGRVAERGRADSLLAAPASVLARLAAASQLHS